MNSTSHVESNNKYFKSEDGKPLAYVSHRLSQTESGWAAVELEAYAIVAAVEHFRHFLLGRKFNILTDQQGVAFLFDTQPRNRIKNSKLTVGDSGWQSINSKFNTGLAILMQWPMLLAA